MYASSAPFSGAAGGGSPPSPGVSSVEVYGFVGWITSSVAYGEHGRRAHSLAVPERRRRQAQPRSTSSAPCSAISSLDSHPSSPASAVPAVGLHTGSCARGARGNLLPVQVVGAGAARLGERHRGVCVLAVREVRRRRQPPDAVAVP